MYDNIIESRARREAVVTFDDGFKDQFQNAYPLLKKMNIPATLFLITSTASSDKLLWLHKLYVLIEQINKDEAIALLTKYSPPPRPDMTFFHLMRHFVFSATKQQIYSLIETLAQKVNWTVDQERELSHQLYLTTDELRTMQSNGFTIETHFHDHWPLHTLSEDQIRHDIEQSISWIYNNLSYRPRFLSYPFGFANQFSTGILSQLNLIGACTVEHRPVQIGEDPYTMPRIYRNSSNCSRFSWQFSVFYLSAIRKRFLRF
jgi:peptidoglycan/xylan/chitin deacetylase (PgdA/CDA1 family)